MIPIRHLGLSLGVCAFGCVCVCTRACVCVFVCCAGPTRLPLFDNIIAAVAVAAFVFGCSIASGGRGFLVFVAIVVILDLVIGIIVLVIGVIVIGVIVAVAHDNFIGSNI